MKPSTFLLGFFISDFFMRNFFQAILIVIAFSVPSYSQVAGQGYEVSQLDIEGNEGINDDQLLNVMHTRETPWVVWKWIYNIFDKEMLGGRKPEYFDYITFSSDYYQVKRCYEDNGFLHSRIDTSIIVYPDEKRLDLSFFITEGRRSIVDTVMYKGFENLSSDMMEELASNKQIKVGDPYVQDKVEAELRRVVGVFANNGYMNVKVVALEAQHYASTDNFTIMFAFQPGKRYTFGKISVDQDTTAPQHIDSTIVLRHLDFKTGEYYSEQKKIESERNLNRLGIFEATKIENAIPNISSEIPQIPTRVLVRTRSFQELTPEIGVSDENNAFNVLFGIGYNHRNIFGGAQNFSTRLRLNIQSLQFRTIFKKYVLYDSSLVSKAEFTTQLVLPYFINNKTSMSFALSLMLDKQTYYYIPSLSCRIGTQSQTAIYSKLFIDWNLQLSDPKTVATQKDTADRKLGFEKQFNSFITITLQRDKRNDIFYPSSGLFQSVTFEEGGFFPRTFGKTIGVNLPYSQYIKLILDGQWYWDQTKEGDLIWATRCRTGAAVLYGDSPLDYIPLTQRFYSGGSGSVRGWKARELGASMSQTQRYEGGNAFFEGNIEARWNLLKDAGSLGFLDLEKISLVFFYDCGNVWTNPHKMRLSEIAMAFGFGLRYNTIAGPIRIDFGMKLYDPDESETKRWVTQKRFFPETFNSGVIHLGVGHTF
jgi:outer membrane protein assembly complex protein YaeT